MDAWHTQGNTGGLVGRHLTRAMDCGCKASTRFPNQYLSQPFHLLLEPPIGWTQSEVREQGNRATHSRRSAYPARAGRKGGSASGGPRGKIRHTHYLLRTLLPATVSSPQASQAVLSHPGASVLFLSCFSSSMSTCANRRGPPKCPLLQEVSFQPHPELTSVSSEFLKFLFWRIL